MVQSVVVLLTHALCSFLKGALQLWWQVCVFLFIVALFWFVASAASGLGLQWTVGVVNMAALWIFSTPAVVYFAVIRGGGLYVAWLCLWPPYFGMVALLVYKIVSFDWEGFSQAVREREGLERKEAETVDETTRLI